MEENPKGGGRGRGRFTLYNVCSVHCRMFSTSEDIMSTSGGYHEYIGGRSVHRRDIMMNGDIEYIGGCSVHWRDTMSTLGDIMSTSGDVQYMHVRSNLIKSFQFLFKTPMY